MTNYKEQATKLFKEANQEDLEDLIVYLNESINDEEPIWDLDIWIEDMRADHDSTIKMLQIMQQAGNNIDLADEYLRESIYYYNYKTADSVLDFFTVDEAIDLIQQGMEMLEDSPDDLDDDIIGILKQEIK